MRHNSIYPKTKYSIRGNFVVTNKMQEAQLGIGWFDSRQEAEDWNNKGSLISAAVAEQYDIEAERQRLFVLAAEKGIPIDKRWGVERLRKIVEHGNSSGLDN